MAGFILSKCSRTPEREPSWTRRQWAGLSALRSAVHDGGNPRAVLRGEEGGGTTFAVNVGMKITVKIISDSPGGGILTVHAANGSPGVIPGTTEHGGAVPVNDPKGKPAASLPEAGFGKKREEEG